LAWLLLAAGCAAAVWDDDDSADDDDVGDDDVGDDDVGDDDVGDDDAGDDDTSLVDLDGATVPVFPDCTGNQIKFILGDGTELGPIDGLDSSSFANNTGQFKIQVGSSAGSWAAITGHQGQMQAGTPITFQTPPDSPGNAVLQSFVAAADIGSSDSALAAAYQMSASALDPRVGGEVTFDSVPAAGQLTSGTFSGIVQWYIGPLTPRIILLGVAGCFSGTLEATDGGGA
jgi:hypothetical protein